MIFYLSLSGIISCLYLPLKKIKNGRKYYFLILIVVLSAVSGLRGSIGVDYKTYREFYNLYIQNGFTSYFEPGYILIEFLSHKLGLGFNGVVFISAVIAQVCVALAIYRYSAMPGLSVFLYMAMGYFYSSMAQIRMYIAISISLLALKFIKDRKLYSYLFITLIAVCFHFTAIVMLPMYCIVNRKWNIKQIVILYILIFAVIFLVRPSLLLAVKLFPQYQYYLRTEYVNGYGIKSLHKSLFILLPLLIHKKQLINMKGETIFYTNCALYGFVISLAQLQIQLLERFAIYLLVPALIFGWPLIIKSYSSKKYQMLVLMCICLFAEIYNIYLLHNGWMDVVPYQTIWG